MGGPALVFKEKSLIKADSKLKRPRKDGPISIHSEKSKEIPQQSPNASKNRPSKNDNKVSQSHENNSPVRNHHVVPQNKDKQVMSSTVTHVAPVSVSGGQPYPSGIGIPRNEATNMNQASSSEMDCEISKDDQGEIPHKSLGAETAIQTVSYVEMQQ